MEFAWTMLAAGLLILLLAGIALFWQVLRRHEASAALEQCQAQVERLQLKATRQQALIRQLVNAARTERVHMEQLRRQLDFARGNRSPVGPQNPFTTLRARSKRPTCIRPFTGS